MHGFRLVSNVCRRSILKGLLGVVRREFSARQGRKEVEYSGGYLLFDIINLKLDTNNS